MVRGLCA